MGIQLGTYLVVEVQQLLQRLGLGGHDESDDMHEQLGHRVAVEHDGQDPLHGLDLALVGALLQLGAQVRERGNIGRVVLVHQAERMFEVRHGDGCGSWCSGTKAGGVSVCASLSVVVS